MSNSSRDLDNRQSFLFEDPALDAPQSGCFASPVMGDLNRSRAIRVAISDALEKARKIFGKDRLTVAFEMSRLLGRDITKTMIDAWASEEKSAWRLPFEVAVAFCVAAMDWSIFEILLKPIGKRLADVNEVSISRFGEINLQMKKLKAERRHLEKVLEQQTLSKKKA